LRVEIAGRNSVEKPIAFGGGACFDQFVPDNNRPDPKEMNSLCSSWRSFCALAEVTIFLAALYPVHAATFEVTTTAGSGPGSLLQAITDANNAPGADTITFNIPGSGVQTISVFSLIITDTVTIDGATQPGFAGPPLIEISGNFTLNTSNCTLNGLVINTYPTGPRNPSSFGVKLGGAGGHLVTGCYIGTDPSGKARKNPIGHGVVVDNCANNTVGGATAAARNLISGNSGAGVLISGPAASNDIVSGNYIGTDIDGTNQVPNNGSLTSAGVVISNAPANTLGGTSPGAGNLISGNVDKQVLILNAGASGNQVQGNRIGLRPDGTGFFATRSSDNGVKIDNAPGNTIGGTVAGAGNVVANYSFGLVISGNNATGNVVQGNFIGTDPSGSVKVPNRIGIYMGGAGSNLIGGAVAGAGNLISGNEQSGLDLANSSGNVVQGNFIGTDVTGMRALGNTTPGTQGQGVSSAGSNNLVGGTNAAARNVISGNNDAGITLFGTTTSSNLIQGNYIGVAADGTTALGNFNRGVQLLGANYNTIGGAASGAGNVVANNGRTTAAEGIWLAATFGTGGNVASNNLVQSNVIYSNGGAGVTLLGPNVISRNSIFNNGGLGINSSGPGSPPVLTSARQGTTTIDGYCEGPPNCEITIELYDSLPSDTDAGGRTFHQFKTVVTDSNGKATFEVVLDETVPVDNKITATGTHKCFANETTKFSEVVIVKPGVVHSFSANSFANILWAGNLLHPISTFTGELFDLLPPDLNLGGPMPLLFQRYYAAFLKKDGLITGKLGDNWLHNFEMTLSTTASNIVNIINNQGRLAQFTNSGGGFTLIGRQDILFQLVTNASNYLLADPRSQLLYTFDNAGRLTSITDGRGNTHTLSYISGQLTSVADGLGRTLTFRYSSGGFLTNVSDGTRSISFAQLGNNLTSSVDALGFVTTYNYDPTNANAGLMTAMVKPEGNAPFTQTFNTNGQVATQTEAGSNTTSLVYSNTTTILTDPLGNVRRDVHTATGELAGFTDEAGQTISIGSDASGHRSSVKDRVGQTTTISFHAPSGYPAAITNADGTATLFAYASRVVNGITFYDLSQITYPDGTMENFTYDAAGNLRTRTDQAGKLWSFDYNTRGQLLAATNPAGGFLSLTYNSDGTLASSTDSDLGLTTYAYDGLRRLTNIVHPDSTVINALFDANDRVVSVTDERTNKTLFAYDRNNRPTQVADANGATNRFAYDSRDRVVQTTDRLAQTGATSYDTLDHVATIKNRNGNVTSFSYDARRRLTSVTDSGLKTWSFGYDNEAVLAAFANPLAQTNTIRTDQLGYPTNFTDALTHSVNLTLDKLRRVSMLLDPIGRTNTFAYDTRGPLSMAGRQGIGAATYQRSELGLLSQLSDLNSNTWRFGYTSMGRPKSVTDPLNRSNAFTYDARGRLQKTSLADGTTRSNVYDPAGNLTRALHSDGTDLQYSYDALNRLVGANNLVLAYDAEGRVTNTASSGVNFGAAYDADGRLTSLTYNGGAFSVTYSYDSRDRLTRVSDSLSGAQIDFTYDDAGRLTGMTRANAVNGAYTYDAAGRLTRIQEGSIIDIQYTLNAAGEVTAASFTAPLDPGGFTNPLVGNFSYDAAHQISASGYAFDARGRQIASPGHTFAWNGASRLVGIDGMTLGYNGLSEIITRMQAGTTLRYFYNHALGGAPIIAEKNDTAGQFLRYYVWSPGGRMLYMIDAANGNAVSYFHFDRVGSTLALSSAGGAVTDAYAYSPYGIPLGRTGTNQQPFTYIGAFGVRSESAAGLYHMRARYYDPATARFLSRDPIWPRLGDPQNLNPYEYVTENPLQFIDPTGLEEVGNYWRFQYDQVSSISDLAKKQQPLYFTGILSVKPKPGQLVSDALCIPANLTTRTVYDTVGHIVPVRQDAPQQSYDPLNNPTTTTFFELSQLADKGGNLQFSIDQLSRPPIYDQESHILKTVQLTHYHERITRIGSIASSSYNYPPNPLNEWVPGHNYGIVGSDPPGSFSGAAVFTVEEPVLLAPGVINPKFWGIGLNPINTRNPFGR
jgi:RHS repeat-associated protein